MTIGTIDNNGHRQLTTGIAGTGDNEIVIETGDVSAFRRHYLSNVSGLADVDASQDGVNFLAVIALTDLESTAPATRVVFSAGPGVVAFEGSYKNIRVRQMGAPPLTQAFMHSAK